MNAWLNPWWMLFRSPLSGNVTQDINPVTSWLSPQVAFNFAGDREIESAVIAQAASYGKQLGILSEALLELANDKDKPGEAVARLKTMMADIDEVKQQCKKDLESDIRSGLDQLKQQDPSALIRLLQEYQ